MTSPLRRDKARHRYTRRAVVFTPLALGIATLVGCSRTKETPDEPALPFQAWPAEDRWPRQFTAAPTDVQEAYRYAVANQDVLQYMPCFCGCGQDGHRSNFDCYVSAQRPDGSVVLDPMSFG